MNALRSQGIAFDSQRDSLEQIARANRTTPMALYGLIQGRQPPPQVDNPPLTLEEIEAKYAGTGLGRKSLTEICRTIGIEPEQGLARLAAAGIEASAEEVARELADRHQLRPIELVAIMLQP
jgi:hypothetical protein